VNVSVAVAVAGEVMITVAVRDAVGVAVGGMVTNVGRGRGVVVAIAGVTGSLISAGTGGVVAVAAVAAAVGAVGSVAAVPTRPQATSRSNGNSIR